MPLEQARDVVAHARSFHRELGEFYQKLEHQVQRERVQLLLEYLVDHEKRMADQMDALEESLPQSVLNTWFKNAPQAPEPVSPSDRRIRPDMSPSEVICLALDLDERMLNVFKQVALQSPVQEVREAFLALYEEGRREREKLVLDMFEPE
ncbi:MAG: hypothetical protein KBA51_05970 [Kiritimatiellae bacterium]|nr:hypothetical protein [Kiritimatiellia bacterium]